MVRWSEEDAAITARWGWTAVKGRSKSRSIEGESSELEVGGVKMAGLMLWEELPIAVIGPLLGMILISGSTDDDPKVDLLLRDRECGGMGCSDVTTTAATPLASTTLASDDRRELELDPYRTLLLRGRFEDEAIVSLITGAGAGTGG